jgi:hypothetical protein
MSTDVNLPKSVLPTFPDRCVACGVEHPEDSYRVGTNAIGWWTLASWSFGQRFSVEVPSCGPCRAGMQRQRWARLAVNMACAIVGVGVGFSVLRWYAGPLKKWLVMAVALVCLLPVVLWETLFPRPLDMTAFSETVDYEFRDATYAQEFAKLNGVDMDVESA